MSLAVVLGVKIVVLAITFGPIVVFGAILVWGAIQDGRDERRSRRVTRG